MTLYIVKLLNKKYTININIFYNVYLKMNDIDMNTI